MTNSVSSNPAAYPVMSKADIKRVLVDCSERKQFVVTTTSDVLQSHSWRNVTSPALIDLSGMNSVRIDSKRRLALVGPGAIYSSLITEAQKAGLAPDIETAACIDFSFADWAHEPLRMLSTSNSGVDGVLRNIKVTAPATEYQTGFDSFPANGGGYDLTKMFLSSKMSLGIPSEFAIPLRPIPDIAVKRICSFDRAESAVSAGAQMSRSGYVRSVKLKSNGFEEMLLKGKFNGQSESECRLVIRLEGTKPIIDAGMKFIDEVLAKSGGKTIEDKPDAPIFVDPMSLNPSVWPLGICVVDTMAAALLIRGMLDISKRSDRAFQYSLSDISPTSSILVPLVQGPYSKELLDAIGSYLADSRVALRGNPYWNSILGDSRAVNRINVVKGIKKLVDPNMILNPHVMEGF